MRPARPASPSFVGKAVEGRSFQGAGVYAIPPGRTDCPESDGAPRRDALMRKLDALTRPSVAPPVAPSARIDSSEVLLEQRGQC